MGDARDPSRALLLRLVLEHLEWEGMTLERMAVEEGFRARYGFAPDTSVLQGHGWQDGSSPQSMLARICSGSEEFWAVKHKLHPDEATARHVARDLAAAGPSSQRLTAGVVSASGPGPTAAARGAMHSPQTATRTSVNGGADGREPGASLGLLGPEAAESEDSALHVVYEPEPDPQTGMQLVRGGKLRALVRHMVLNTPEVSSLALRSGGVASGMQSPAYASADAADGGDDGGLDVDYVESFFVTMHAFSSAEDVLGVLEELYESDSSYDGADAPGGAAAGPSQDRVLNSTVYWLRFHFADLPAAVRRRVTPRLQAFIRRVRGDAGSAAAPLATALARALVLAEAGDAGIRGGGPHALPGGADLEGELARVAAGSDGEEEHLTGAGHTPPAPEVPSDLSLSLPAPGSGTSAPQWASAMDPRAAPQVGRALARGLSMDDPLWRLPPREVARQWTLIETQFFNSIPLEELLGKAWSRPRHEHRAENVRRLIDRFNAVSLWVTTACVQADSPEGRAAMITWFAEVAVSLRALQNFHGTCAVLSGLDKNAVTRMTATMDRLDPAVHQRLEELRELYSEANRYKNYRAALKRVAGLRPAVPHLAVHLSDLTFMEDGAPDVLPDSDGMINFGKWQLVASVVALLRSLQRQRYALVPIPAVSNALTARLRPHYHYFDEDRDRVAKQLYSMSVQREPSVVQ